MEDKKPVMGRPTKYSSDYCEMLINHMSKGKSYETFGITIGVSKQTLYDWEKVNPDFLDAKKLAFDACLSFWEDMGIEGCWNKPGEKTLNTGVWVFNMKNRFKWTDRVEVQGSGDDEKPLVLAYKK
jgi:hypothetical protein